MPANAEPLLLRLVLLPSRVEWHASGCRCRVPADAEAVLRERSAVEVAEVHAEALDLNDGPSPIKPCLRRAAGIAR